MNYIYFIVVRFMLIAGLSVSLTACGLFALNGQAPPAGNRAMEFEPGISLLAGNIADQLDASSIGNMVNKVINQNFAGHKRLKKITVDPFIDVESGYPVKSNALINEIVARKIGKRFEVTGEMDPDNLEVSDYVLNGMVTIEDSSSGREKVYKVFATLFEKASGKILAATSVYLTSFDTTPLDIYKDCPVFLKGNNYAAYVSSVRKRADDTINKGYRSRLNAKSLLVKGDSSYEKKEFKKSLAFYNQVAGGQGEAELEVLAGQFTNLVKAGNLSDAELVYGKLLRASVAESSEIANKIIFGPNSITPLESNRQLYQIYLKNIASLVAASRTCSVLVIGHCSKSGSDSYNDRLSLQRAEWIQNQMASYSPRSKAKSQVVGRGFRENIVGTGRDDITDAIDRRVEFKFSNCDVPEESEAASTSVEISEPKEDSLRPPGPKGPKPLEVDDIEYYLKNKVSSKLIAARVAERGVNFELNDSIRLRLLKFKADDRIFKAIVNAGKKE